MSRFSGLICIPHPSPTQRGESILGNPSKKLLGILSKQRVPGGGRGDPLEPLHPIVCPRRVPGLSTTFPLPGPRVKGEKPLGKEPRGKAKGQHTDPPPPEHDFLGCMSK